MVDALVQITEMPDNFRRFSRQTPAPSTNLPLDCRATQVADGSAESQVPALFGRPPRATPYERERGAEINLSQVLFFINSGEVEWSIGGSPRLRRLLEAKKSDAEIVEEYYLAAFSRFPTEKRSRS